MKLIKSLLMAVCVLALVGNVVAEEKAEGKSEGKKKQSCCEKAKAAGKDCDHPCCVTAKKDGKDCAKCNAKKGKKAEAKAEDKK